MKQKESPFEKQRSRSKEKAEKLSGFSCPCARVIASFQSIEAQAVYSV